MASGRILVDDGTPLEFAGSRDREILRRLREGDREGLGELIDGHGEALMQYLVSILHDRSAAEDAFQDTWVRVVERIHRWDPRRPFAPWLFRVARNRAYDELRRGRRWRLLGLSAFEEGRDGGGGPGAPAVVERVEAREEAGRLLAQLEPAYREAICLRFYHECSYEEIARICRVPLGTVKSRLRRALLRLGSLHSRKEREDDVPTGR